MFQLQAVLVVLGLAILPVAILNPAQRLLVIGTALFTNGASLVSYLLARRGHLNAASYLILGSVTAALIYLDYTGRGETRPVLLFSIVPIFVAGWVLGARVTIGTAVVMAVSHAIIVYMDSQNLFTFEPAPIPVAQRMFLVGFGYIGSAVLFRLAVRRIQGLLERARENERAARQSSLMLEEAQTN